MPSNPGRCRSVCAVALCAAAVLTGCDFGERRLPHDAASPQRIARGKALLAQYQCGSCHAIPGVEAAQGAAGPPLDAFGRRSYIVGHLPNRPAMLARWIESPQALVPGTTMPSMGVSPEDARAMAGYLLALE